MNIQAETRNKMPSKRQIFIIIPFALCYAAFIVLGDVAQIMERGIARSAVKGFLCFCISYIVLLALCFALDKRSLWMERIPLLRRLPAQRKRQGKWYIYLIFFAICFLCYLPYFLMYFPTWFSNDAVWQMKQALGWVKGSNHHPYFHTMIIKFFITVGYRLFGTYSGAAAFYTFWQMAVMALTFAFFLYQLYKRGTRLLWLLVATAFYALLPINGILTICMGKDEFFVASLFFFAWISSRFHLEEKKTILQYAAYIATGLLVCLLRSNGIFIFVGTAFCTLLCAWRGEKRAGKKGEGETSEGKACETRGNFPVGIFLCIVGVLFCYAVYSGPVLRALQVEPPDTIESLAMPTQHIMCAYLKGGELTEEEIGMLAQVAPLEELADYYNPYLFDVAKGYIREYGDQQVIADNRWAYFKLWLRVGLRNPMQYLVAEIRQTAGYWAYRTEHYEYVYGDYFMVDNPFGLETERKLFSYDAGLAMNDFLMGFRDFYNKVWSLGLNTWLMLFGLTYIAYEKRNAMFYVPYLILLGTLFLATPVYNEFRYAYGLFAALPLLLSEAFSGNCAERDGLKTL